VLFNDSEKCSVFVDDVVGGCHGGAVTGDTRVSQRGAHQAAASPNGFVSD